MSTHKSCPLRLALLFISLLFGSASALAQKTTSPLLPNVNLGLPKVGLPILPPPPAPSPPAVTPPISLPVLPPPPAAPPVLPVALPALPTAVPPPPANTGKLGISVNVPPVGGLTTAPLNAGASVSPAGASLGVTVPPVSGLTTSPLNVAVEVDSEGAAVSTTVPAVRGLTPALGAKVNVNTAAPGPAVQAGVNVGGSWGAPGSGTPLAAETLSAATAAAPRAQVAEKRIELLPTCR